MAPPSGPMRESISIPIRRDSVRAPRLDSTDDDDLVHLLGRGARGARQSAADARVRQSINAGLQRVGKPSTRRTKACLFLGVAIGVLILGLQSSGVKSDHVLKAARKPFDTLFAANSSANCEIPTPILTTIIAAPTPVIQSEVAREPELPPTVPGFGALSNPANIYRNRFLVPLYSCNEQETGSQMHVRQLLHLARSINRTLVLPNWGFGAPSVSNCRPYAFNEIYETESANQIGLWNVPFPTWWRYITRNDKAGPLTARMAIIFVRDAFDRLTRVVAPDDNDVLTEACVPIAPFQFTDPALYVATRSQSDLSRIMAALKETDQNDVLFVHLHYCAEMHKTPPTLDPLLQQRPEWGLWSGLPWPQWNYSSQIVDIATRAKEALPEDYVAMQWRMELTPPDILQRCSDLFAEAIIQGMRSRGRRTIYVATDMPIGNEKDRSKSASFNAPEVAQARGSIEHLLRRLNEAEFDVRSWNDVVPDDTDPEFAEGASGIFDRIILGDAARLYAANPYCGFRSSYLGSIQTLRQDRIGDPTETDWEKLAVTWIGHPIKEAFWWHHVKEDW